MSAGAGTLVERGPGRYWLKAYAGRDPITGRKVYRTKVVRVAGIREARRELAAFVAEVSDVLPSAGGTLGALLDAYLDLKGPSWSGNTRRVHRGIVGSIPEAWKARRLDRVTTFDLDRLYAEMMRRGGKDGGPLTAATVKRTHVVIRAALEQAVRWEWLPSNPASRCAELPVEEAEVVPPTVEALVAFLADLEEQDEELAELVFLAATTGARRGVLLALRDSDFGVRDVVLARKLEVDNGGPIEVPAVKGTKRAAGRIALDPYTVEVARRSRARREARATAAGVILGPDALLFSEVPACDRPYWPSSVSRRFRKARVGVEGLEGARLHDLRHFLATSLLSAGVDPKTVAARGGWRRASTMLDRYAHAIEANDVEAAGLMGALLRPVAG